VINRLILPSDMAAESLRMLNSLFLTFSIPRSRVLTENRIVLTIVACTEKHAFSGPLRILTIIDPGISHDHAPTPE
jgi:hypothetical protein